MIRAIKDKTVRILRWSEKYTKTDMVYFASGNFWLTLSRVISVGTGMLLTIAFANLLPKEVFGTYKYILSIAGFIGAFSLSGMGTALTRAVAQGHENTIRPSFRTSLIWSLPASGLSLCASVYYFVSGNNALSVSLLLIAITNLFSGYGLYKSLLQGKGDFKTVAIYNIPKTLGPVIAIVGAILIWKSVIAVLIAYFASNFIAGWLTYHFSLKRYPLVRTEPDPAKVKETVDYAKHLSVIGLVLLVASQTDPILLGHFSGPAELAIYAFALAPVREIRNFTENFFPVIFPKFAMKSAEMVKKALPLRLFQMSIASAAVAVAYIVAAPFIFKIFFPQYLSAVFASQIMALAILVQPKGLIETFLIAHGQVKRRYAVIISTHAVEIGLFILLIPPYGIMGAVTATLVSEVVSAIVLYIAYRTMPS